MGMVAIRQASIKTLNNAFLHLPNKKLAGVVVTCSALKKSYRDFLRTKPVLKRQLSSSSADLGKNSAAKWGEEPDVNAKECEIRIHFLYLSADNKMLTERVKGRKGHYMDANMVDSQLADLEEPINEVKDTLVLDARRPADEVGADAVRIIRGRMTSG